MKCPICHNPILPENIKCPKCEFDSLQHDFVNQTDAEYWYHGFVLPYRANWLSTLSDFYISGLCVERYYGKNDDVILPFGITRIESAFRNNKTIRSVVIPEGVTTIGKCAFQGCENLNTIILPKSLVDIEGWAFDGCISLQSLDLPQNLQMIGSSAFKDCKKIVDVYIPQSVAWMSDDVFENCSSLKTVYVGEETEIHHKSNNVLKGCDGNLQLIRYPHKKNEPSIPFFWTNEDEEPMDKFWEEFTPRYGEIIDKYISANKYVLDNNSCFVAQHNLISYVGNESEITISDEVYSIGNRAFAYSSVEKVVIPSSVKVIYPEAFLYCKKLKEIILPDGLREISNGMLLDSGIEHITIPSSVYKIGDDAFKQSHIKSLSIPDSVTEIGQGAFANCQYLEEVKLPNELIHLKIGTFNQCKNLKTIILPKTLRFIGVFAFCSCESLKEIVLPEGIISIELAFHSCISLKKINIPSSVTLLNGSFINCKAMEEIHLPPRLQKISSIDFIGCNNLKKMRMPYHLRYDGYGNETRFRGCHECLTIEYY